MVRRLAAPLLLLALTCAGDALAGAQADKLLSQHAQLREALQHNDFGRPVQLRSSDASGRLQGDVYAVLDHPYAALRDNMATPASWCDILVLPFNVKGCESHGADGLSLYVGRTAGTRLSEAARIDFHFALAAREDDFMEARMDAASGPVGTHDYRIRFEAAPLDERRTFVHMSYGYGYGTLSRLAMQTYLATTGAAKVGFSRDESGAFVGGMRGVLERNTMRYFLAIDAFLDALDGPPQARATRRLESWFREAERYPRQLHEMDRAEYLAMKRRELESPARRIAASN